MGLSWGEPSLRIVPNTALRRSARNCAISSCVNDIAALLRLFRTAGAAEPIPEPLRTQQHRGGCAMSVVYIYHSVHGLPRTCLGILHVAVVGRRKLYGSSWCTHSSHQTRFLAHRGSATA